MNSKSKKIVVSRKKKSRETNSSAQSQMRMDNNTRSSRHPQMLQNDFIEGDHYYPDYNGMVMYNNSSAMTQQSIPNMY